MFIILRLTWSISHPSCLFDWYRLIGAKRDFEEARHSRNGRRDRRVSEFRLPSESESYLSTMRVVRSKRQTVVKSRKSREMAQRLAINANVTSDRGKYMRSRMAMRDSVGANVTFFCTCRRKTLAFANVRGSCPSLLSRRSSLSALVLHCYESYGSFGSCK